VLSIRHAASNARSLWAHQHCVCQRRDDHAQALTADGHVVAWGDNFSGQTSVPRPRTWWPLRRVGICARAVIDGSVRAWGSDMVGRIDVPSDHQCRGYFARFAQPWLRSDGSVAPGAGEEAEGYLTS
jgi:hypothetical protein